MPQRNKTKQSDAPAVLPKRRERTREKLIAEAIKLTRHGRFGSVTEVAQAAGISRATAYRYFPNQARLINAIVEATLDPVRNFDSAASDGVERIHTLFDKTFPIFKEFEPQLRAALQLALEHWALERAGTLAEEPFRRGHRARILQRAAAPLKQQLGAKVYAKLLRGLSLIYGIESYVILKDIWGANDREVHTLTRWVMDAIIRAAIDDAKTLK